MLTEIIIITLVMLPLIATAPMIFMLVIYIWLLTLGHSKGLSCGLT